MKRNKARIMKAEIAERKKKAQERLQRKRTRTTAATPAASPAIAIGCNRILAKRQKSQNAEAQALEAADSAEEMPIPLSQDLPDYSEQPFPLSQEDTDFLSQDFEEPWRQKGRVPLIAPISPQRRQPCQQQHQQRQQSQPQQRRFDCQRVPASSVGRATGTGQVGSMSLVGLDRSCLALILSLVPVVDGSFARLIGTCTTMQRVAHSYPETKLVCYWKKMAARAYFDRAPQTPPVGLSSHSSNHTEPRTVIACDIIECVRQLDAGLPEHIAACHVGTSGARLRLQALTPSPLVRHLSAIEALTDDELEKDEEEPIPQLGGISEACSPTLAMPCLVFARLLLSDLLLAGDGRSICLRVCEYLCLRLVPFRGASQLLCKLLVVAHRLAQAAAESEFVQEGHGELRILLTNAKTALWLFEMYAMDSFKFAQSQQPPSHSSHSDRHHRVEQIPHNWSTSHPSDLPNHAYMDAARKSGGPRLNAAQRAVVEAPLRPGTVTRVIALAGCGKTTTIKELALRASNTCIVQLLVFNKAICHQTRESIAAMGSRRGGRDGGGGEWTGESGGLVNNIRTKTLHALGIKWYREENGFGKMDIGLESTKVKETLKAMLIPLLRAKGVPDANANFILKLVLKILSNYFHSTDTALSREHTFHCAYWHLKWNESRRRARSASPQVEGKAPEKEAISIPIEPYPEYLAWASVVYKYLLANQMFSFDMVFKLYSLTDPRIQCGVLIVDEAQDLSKCMLQTIIRQADKQTAVYLVGDANQAIYGWRGAVTRMEFNCQRTFRVSKTFRFGVNLELAANAILALLNPPAVAKSEHENGARVGIDGRGGRQRQGRPGEAGLKASTCLPACHLSPSTSPMIANTRIQSQLLPALALHGLPNHCFSSHLHKRPPTAGPAEVQTLVAAQTACPVCSTAVAEGEKISVWPGCKHPFHVHCINPYLSTGKRTCPVCQAPMTPSKGLETVDSLTVICRSNLGLFKRMFAHAAAGARIYCLRAGGAKAVKTTFGKLNSLLKLQQGKSSYFLWKSRRFKSFEQFQSYAEEDEDDADASTLCQLITEHGDKLSSILDDTKGLLQDTTSEANVMLTTVHQAKGLEWNNVVLHDDFLQLGTLQNFIRDINSGRVLNNRQLESISLLYVAATRARRRLVPNRQLAHLLTARYPQLPTLHRLRARPRPKAGAKAETGKAGTTARKDALVEERAEDEAFCCRLHRNPPANPSSIAASSTPDECSALCGATFRPSGVVGLYHRGGGDGRKGLAKLPSYGELLTELARGGGGGEGGGDGSGEVEEKVDFPLQRLCGACAQDERPLLWQLVMHWHGEAARSFKGMKTGNA